MRQIRILSIGIPINMLMIGTSILYGMVLGYTISAGKTKTFSFLLIPTVLYIFKTLSGRIKFWLLAISIPLSLLQIPRLPLPYGTQVSEAILLFLALDEILFPHHEDKPNLKRVPAVIFFLLGLFALSGLIANLNGNILNAWNVYCFLPLVIFFVVSRKIHKLEDAWLLVKLSLITIIGFITIIQLATMTGHYVIYDPIGTEKMARYFRLADGLVVVLGPIRLTSFATRIGAIAALGLPTCVLLWLQNKGKVFWKAVLLLIIAIFGYVIILSATRGSLIAAIAGIGLVIIFSGRFRSPIFVGAGSLAMVILSIWGEKIINKLPSYNIQRLLTLSQGVGSIANYHQRMDVLSLSWELTQKNPLGVGFGYLYKAQSLDDAIIYAIILQATGIFGAIAFLLLMVYLAFQFSVGIMKSHIGSMRDLASIGLSTLATGLVAGVSSQSILFDPVHSFVFWTLLAVGYISALRFSS